MASKARRAIPIRKYFFLSGALAVLSFAGAAFCFAQVSSNKMSIGPAAQSTKALELKLNPLSTLNFKSKAEVLALRKSFAFPPGGGPSTRFCSAV